MNRMGRRSVAVSLFALGLLLALAACAARTRFPAGLDFATFQRSPTAFGGVVTVVYGPDLGLDDPQAIDEVMEGAFMTRRHDLRFVSAGVVRERIGVERHLLLLDRYRDGAGIDTSAYQMLAQAMGADAGYLALARIESVSVTYDRTTSDPDYNVKTDNDNVIKSTERNVWITFNLFDLAARREIWNETWKASAVEQVSFPAPTGTSAWAFIKELLSSEPDYPPRPSAFDALDEGFTYFAMRIPRR